MKTLTYKNGDQMPVFGLGTWKSEPGEVYKAVMEAIKIGYRHIDCAPVYGNEKEVGQAITDSIKKGIVHREELWITSKLWNNAHKKELIQPAIEKTLSDLQIDYLDLYLIHWPVVLKPDVSFPKTPEGFETLENVPLEETWAGMEKLKENGLAKHIGVCNFNIKNLNTIMAEAQIAPEMNQVELHPYLSQNELLHFCKQNKIHVTAYSPLGSKDRPDRLKEENEPVLLDDGVLKEIANNHGASTAQILISWAISRDTAVIPKSVNPGRLKENFDAQKIELTDKEIEMIKGLDKNRRYVSGSFWTTEGSPYSIDFLWG